MNLAASFAALADETRWNLLAHLGEYPSSASKLAKQFPVSRQAINKHLAVLEAVGLVESRMVGRERRYEAVGAELSALGRRLDHVAKAWDRRLAGLKKEAES
jgi:DNA-binding transcriptional ArsR family regulator